MRGYAVTREWQCDSSSSFTDDQRKTFDDALAAAGVDHVVEKYPAKHGWVLTDTPVYDADCAERHWTTLLGLLEQTLK